MQTLKTVNILGCYRLTLLLITPKRNDVSESSAAKNSRIDSFFVFHCGVEIIFGVINSKAACGNGWFTASCF